MLEELSINRRTALKHVGLAALATSLLNGRTSLRADELSALGAGQQLNDQRLGELRHLNSYFPFTPPADSETWRKRAEYVRRRILVASGLWPSPETTPIKAVIHGTVDRPEYTVSRVYFESAPGLYVTGSLYRPKASGEQKLPAILCPHGHWADGRFFEHGESAMQAELQSGAEKYPNSGRYPLQARCVQLARMGCLVFHYDMLGYADSAPLTQMAAHTLNQQRPEMTSPDHWGIFSAQAELRLINVVGLQTFNSIRILDWITSLPEVDTSRIGVTGASGGGTQTFLLAAVDDRPAAAFPAVMVSTAMQGGCTCENACYLRIDTGNVEFAALTAPRPLGLTAANDWTVEIETKGLPELRQLYDMLGVSDRVEGKYFDFGHNYNFVSRAMMYEFFNRHLNLGHTSPIEEQDFTPLSREELTVWTDEHPKPPCDAEAEVQLMRNLDSAWQRQFAAMQPNNQAEWESFRETIAAAIDIMVGRPLPPDGTVTYEPTVETNKGNYLHFTGIVRNTRDAEELPALFLQPNDWNREVVLWVDPRGKQSLFDAAGRPIPAIQWLLDNKLAIGSIDVLYTGEFVDGGEPPDQYRKVPNNNREIAAFTLGYNHPLFAQRVHDLLSLISFVKNHPYQPERIHLVGRGGAAAAWAAAACLPAGDAVQKLALVTEGFRFAQITNIWDANLWPGAVKYGDLPGLAALGAPRPLWLAGEGATAPELIRKCYAAAGAANQVTSYSGPDEKALQALVEWVAKK